MIDLPESAYSAIEDICHAIWMDAFASGVVTGCNLFLPDEAAHHTSEEVINEAVARSSLVEVIRQSIRERIFDYRCEE